MVAVFKPNWVKLFLASTSYSKGEKKKMNRTAPHRIATIVETIPRSLTRKNASSF
jgi:hypothetical protein